MAQGVQIGLLSENESVLAVVPTINLIVELIELQNRNMVVGKTLGEELEMTKTMAVPKLKMELAESGNSLKATLEAVEACRKKCAKIA